jgi:hypothetical protein
MLATDNIVNDSVFVTRALPHVPLTPTRWHGCGARVLTRRAHEAAAQKAVSWMINCKCRLLFRQHVVSFVIHRQMNCARRV